jgi:phosphate starvation-inducible PhoH-like protein
MYKAKGYNQKIYNEYLENNDNSIIVAVGPAGTGKTMFACMKAINLLKSGHLNKIIITRPVVPVEEDIGFLPGNIVKKMDPWTRPIFDMFLEFFSKSELDNMIYNGIIEVSPLAYMRGRTFKNAFIIADEMQNSSPNQMMMLTTRIGINSRMVITGDLKQTDKSRDNGLIDFINKVKTYYDFNKMSNETDCIKLVELTGEDVERSETVKKVIDIYNYKKELPVLKNTITNVTLVDSKDTNNVTIQDIFNEQINYNYTITTTNTTGKYIYDNNYDAALIPKSLITKHYSTFRKIWE